MRKTLHVNERIRIPTNEFQMSFVRSGGPGGQNVNKVASRAVLRWNLIASPSLPADVKARLCVQQRGRITTEGNLVVSSQRYRDQPRNIDDCLEKVSTLILQAAAKPRPRKPTRPTRGAREARLQVKRRRSAAKRGRQPPGEE